MSLKLTFNVLLQIHEIKAGFFRKYKVVHRGWREDIVRGDYNLDLNVRKSVRARN